MVLALFGDSGFGGSFVVLPECWNMLVCHDARHTLVLGGMIETNCLNSPLIRSQDGVVDL